MLPRLEGQVEAKPNREQELIQSIRSLERMNDELDAENKRMKRAILALRSALQPQYVALQAIFGEIEIVGEVREFGAPDAPAQPQKSAVWEKWINQFGRDTMAARFILALIDHREMSAAQLRVVMQCRQQTVYEMSNKLAKLGLINRNGGKYSLKEL